jgi:hypothetical protein
MTSLHAKGQRQEHRFAIIVFMPSLLFNQDFEKHLLIFWIILKHQNNRSK